MGAPTVAESGTVVSDGTEQTAVTITTPGAYEFHIDRGALVNTEVLVCRIKEAVLSGGTVRSLAYNTYTATGSGAPEPTTLVLGPVSIDQSGIFTIQRTSGSARSHPWKVKRVS